jgi:hypothetical protein
MRDIPLSATLGSPADMEAMNGEPDLAAMAEMLRASGRYRVQRRLEARLAFSVPDESATRTALFVDVCYNESATSS